MMNSWALMGFNFLRFHRSGDISSNTMTLCNPLYTIKKIEYIIKCKGEFKCTMKKL